MAKKKKQEAKKENGIKVELTGILLILLSIIGIARLGIVGKFVQAFATFLVGEIYNVTDNAVRKWCKKYNMPYHSKDYK